MRTASGCPFNLSEAEIDDLVAVLETLTPPDAAKTPAMPQRSEGCGSSRRAWRIPWP
jgi:hypothetical protein